MVWAVVGNIGTYKYQEFMKPIFNCFSVCQGVQELLLLGRKENSQGMKFSTQSSRPAMVKTCTLFALWCIKVLGPWTFLCRPGGDSITQIWLQVCKDDLCHEHKSWVLGGGTSTTPERHDKEGVSVVKFQASKKWCWSSRFLWGF